MVNRRIYLYVLQMNAGKGWEDMREGETPGAVSDASVKYNALYPDANFRVIERNIPNKNHPLYKDEE